MPKVRPGGAKRYADRAALAGPEYLSGVENPRKPWAEATKAAEGNWLAGVTKAGQDKRFGRGVDKAGNSKYLKGVQEKGVGRYEEGVRLAEDAYADGIAPYLQVIESITLPPRGPKGSPQNIKRVEIMSKALHEKKTRG